MMTSSTSYPLGRLEAADERDHAHLMASLIPPEHPPLTSVEYRRGPILNQGSIPSCVGHGWRAWLNGAPVRQEKSGPTADELYHAAQEVDEWPGHDYAGTSVRGGAKVLAAAGFMTEYVWAFDEGTVKRWVLDGHGGVVIGIQWYSGMFKPDSLGFLSMTGTIEGGHCLWLRGYNEPRDAYRLQNSWGLGWGQLGQAWLRARDLNVLLAAGGEACCGIEQRVRLQGG